MISHPPSVIIRDARDDERSAIQALTLRSYEQYASMMPPKGWEMLRNAVLSAVATTASAERIVAEQNGALVGSVMLFPAEVNAYGSLVNASSVPEVRVLAVAPETRGQGIGRLLVEACIERARRSGASALGLHTGNVMITAKRMYEQMGFERYPADDFNPGGGEVVMAYRLPLT